MRKTIVLGTTLILSQIPLQAHVLLQQRTWGGANRDGANGVAVAGDGSVYVTGSTRSFGVGDDDAMLLKYAPNGTLMWQRTYGTAPDPLNSGEESGIDVAVAPDNSGVVVLGNYRDGNIFLAKFDPAGLLIWDLTWGAATPQESADAITIAANGTIYVTGFTSSFGAGQGDAFLLSFTSLGALNWQKTWGGAGFDVPNGVAVASDGNIYIAGDTQFNANSAFLVKFAAADGSVIWQREWGLVGKNGVPGETQGTGVAAAPAGGAYVSGSSTGAGADPNLLVARFDADGNFVWQRVGGPGFGNTQDIAVGPDGSVHVTGSILVQGSGGNAFVWTLLANGRGNDASVWGGSDPFEGENGQSIATAPDGTILVAGSAGTDPYTFSRGSKNAKAASTFLATIVGTITTPTRVPGGSAAVVQTPAGSETFAGVSDAFLLRVQP